MKTPQSPESGRDGREPSSSGTIVAEAALAFAAGFNDGRPELIERDILAVLTHAEVREALGAHLDRRRALVRVSAAPAAVSPDAVSVIFELACAPGEIAIPPPAILVQLDRQGDRLLRILDPYRLPPMEAFGGLQPQTALPLVLAIPPAPLQVIRTEEEMREAGRGRWAQAPAPGLEQGAPTQPTER